MCEEESDDQEAVARLFEINDSINRTIERYKLITKGDVEAAQKIPQGTLGTSTGVGKNANNELSLIDFGADSEADRPGADTPATSKTQSVQDDLLGLSLEDSNQPYGQGGGIALGYGANTSQSYTHYAASNTLPWDGIANYESRYTWSVPIVLTYSTKLCQNVVPFCNSSTTVLKSSRCTTCTAKL